ncbi:MAG TPA: ribosome-associated translation inhibitor RaiA [Ktedonobacteraceae bacterium]|nr:ribosome-associated translation inhibitor RaiA [Ktedonobacteraceae bacterium]
MQIIITSRQMEITPRLRQHIERKVQRLSRLVNQNTRVEVIVAEERTRSARDRYSVQLAISGASHPIRSEVSAQNANMALDLVLDKITTQLGRQKDRQKTTLRHRTPAMKILSLSRSGELSAVEDEQDTLDKQISDQDIDGLNEQFHPTITEEHNEEIWSRVMEIRRIQTKPMNDQEAIAQMVSLGISFYPFFNEATNSINVMYRLETGGYGLLVPDLEQ